MSLFYLSQTLFMLFDLYVAVPSEQTQVGKVGQGTPTKGETLSTVDLLIKVACFDTNVNNIFNLK